MQQSEDTQEALAPLRVELGPRSYQIHIGPGLLRRAGQLIAQAATPGRGFIITHPRIDQLHGAALRESITAFPAEMITVPPGERQKTLRRAAMLYDQLLARGAERGSAVIAFGGGVIGDLAGFVAATYMRGIVYVQVPTTLLAQVDASIGGKVGVDHPEAKNLIGAFHQPRVVIADSDVLHTLRGRDYRAGLAEVVKHAVIGDPGFFGWLEENVRALLQRASWAVAHSVRRSGEIKAEVVRQDERETGLRAVLNLGHTVGHALETVTGYRAFRHGEAVSIGLVAAARLAEELGMLTAGQGDAVAGLLGRLRLPTRLPEVRLDDLLAAMAADKKALAGMPRFVLPRGIGSVQIGCEVPESALRRVLGALGARA